MSGSLVVPYKLAPPYPKADAYIETFFRCTETVDANGLGSMVDSVRGAIYTPSAGGQATLLNGVGTPANSLYPAFLQGTSDSVQLSGVATWPNFRQRSIVVFACGKIIDGTKLRIPIGHGGPASAVPAGSSGCISVSCVGRPHILVRGSTTAEEVDISLPLGQVWDMPPNGTDVGMAVEYRPNTHTGVPSFAARLIDTNGKIFDFGTPAFTDTNGTTTYIPTQMSFEGSVPTIGDVTPNLNNRTRFGGAAYYGLAAFSFPTVLPSREVLDAAYVEMMADWIAGRKFLPSQFRYLNQIP